jgi:hypothetical protein
VCCVAAAGCCAPPVVNAERQEHAKTQNVGHRQDYFYSTQRAAMSAKNTVLQNIIRYCTINLHFPMLCIWSIDGNSAVHWRHPISMDGPVAQLNKMCFFEQLSLSTVAKFAFVIQNATRYFKQYLFCVSTQHIPSFLLIMLNWSIEGNLYPHRETACCVLKRSVTKH